MEISMTKTKSDQHSVNQILEQFERTSSDYFSLKDFQEKLRSGKQLKIKYGVDVTAPFLHLGHAVNLWMMRLLQDHGHKVQFLIGDFTTRIGDPTGKSDTRPIIPRDIIEKNGLEFVKQVSSVLITDNPDLFEVRRNSEWFDPMKSSELLDLLSLVTHTRLISRDMFQQRIEDKKEIYMHELIYPVLQGYDSFMLESDLTIVGSDQLFNEMMGKFYQEKMGQNSQIIITTKITPGLDGKNKQSKSLNNYISLNEDARGMFGKAMSMPDSQIIQWMEVYTNLGNSEIKGHEIELQKGNNPRDIKLALARALVEKYHGAADADAEFLWFVKTFSAKDFPVDCDTLPLTEGLYSILDIIHLYDATSSKSEIRRLIQQGAVKIDGVKVQDVDSQLRINSGDEKLFKVGKRTHFKLKGHEN
ncbi:tyrosine--tRNA ligase [Dyadobacter sp. 32]|uniref:tyrosine--tRNA ligase n=1 Tax=Dyadobacter sp. 32 TaxID=538966 RepID=UPI0039C6C1E3